MKQCRKCNQVLEEMLYPYWCEDCEAFLDKAWFLTPRPDLLEDREETP